MPPLPHHRAYGSPHTLRHSFANIARAKELIGAPIPKIEPPAAHDAAGPDATTDHRPLCPCCGGRMIIVEIFGRGGTPRGPPSSAAGIRT